MIGLNYTDRILIFGKNGRGKTYLANTIIKRFSRNIVISPYEDEFTEFKNVVYTTSPQKVQDIITKAYAEGNIMVVVDDADLFLNRFSLETEGIVRDFIIKSRHRNTGYVMMARRTQDMPKLLFDVANKVFFFQTDMKRNLQIIEDNYGEENALKVKGLNVEKHEFLFLDTDKDTSEVLVA